MGEEVKPCPFCGSDSVNVHDSYVSGTGYMVLCGDCTGEGPLCNSEDEARAAWNRRSAPVEVDAEGLLGNISPTIVDEDGLPQVLREVLYTNGRVTTLTALYEFIDAWGEKQRQAAIAADRARRAPVSAERDMQDASLLAIREAIADYYSALNARQHSGVAMDRSFRAIEREMGMTWEMWNNAERSAPSPVSKEA